MFIDFFATEVALITTNSSKYRPNAMAFEWTMQIAYVPILIAIHTRVSYLSEYSRDKWVCSKYGLRRTI
jgi:flavin reductase (DIM6/NTAB) family NADH-FMN oxidoreductase RutF